MNHSGKFIVLCYGHLHFKSLTHINDFLDQGKQMLTDVASLSSHFVVFITSMPVYKTHVSQYLHNLAFICKA